MTKKNHMKCSECGADIDQNQNFCGDCGQELNKICPGCSAANLPYYKFCGQCGEKLLASGTLLLDRAGLIIEANEPFLDLLALQSGTTIGKPFSLLIYPGDLALYFSHRNELVRSGRTQTFEVKLNSMGDVAVHAQLVLSNDSVQGDNVEQTQVEVDDVSSRHHSQQEIQDKNKLLEIIATLTDSFHPPVKRVGSEITHKILKEIARISSGQSVFIARIDKTVNQLLTVFMQDADDTGRQRKNDSGIDMQYIQSILDKLQKGATYVVSDIEGLALPERQIWQTWHHLQTGAIVSEGLYHGQKLAGIIGVIRSTPGHWSRTDMMLVRLAGNLMAPVLPLALPEERSKIALPPPSLHHPEMGSSQQEEKEASVVDFNDIEIISESTIEVSNIRDLSEQMLIEPDVKDGPDDTIPVMSTYDGKCNLICPNCEKMESVSMSVFEDDGWILKVSCPCENSFRVIREMRQTYRKDVQLRGLFTRKDNGFSRLAASSSWSPIEVTNISKSGVNFNSPKARMFQLGDQVQLQFALDNSKKSAINKSAEIKSIFKNKIGCQFQGSDKNDVTLGFYFL